MLLDFFDDVYASADEFLVCDDGYRSWSHSYEQVRGGAYTFAARLRREQIAKGDKIILPGENRSEWIVALWGCLSEGVIVVPIDYRSSADLVRCIQGIVQPPAVMLGDDVTLDGNPGSVVVGAAPLERELEEFWSRLGSLSCKDTASPKRRPSSRSITPSSQPEAPFAPDGETLVWGESVTPGYFKAEKETATACDGGWCHTGDVGELDESGRLCRAWPKEGDDCHA